MQKKADWTRSIVLCGINYNSFKIFALLEGYTSWFKTRKFIFKRKNGNKVRGFWACNKDRIWWRKKKYNMWNSKLYRAWNIRRKVRPFLWGGYLVFRCNNLHFNNWQSKICFNLKIILFYFLNVSLPMKPPMLKPHIKKLNKTFIHFQIAYRYLMVQKI